MSHTPQTEQNFQQRRFKLAQLLMPNSIAIIPAAQVTYRNNDVEHEWRQNSTFHYLTGIDEAEAILIISNVPKTAATIFCQSKDLTKEIWEGLRIGTEHMVTHYHIDTAYELKEFDQKMPELLSQCESIYFDFGENSTLDQQLFEWLKQLQKQSRLGKQAPEKMHFLAPVIAQMRLYKEATEIELMRQAGHISVTAHKKAMLETQKQHNEAQVTATLEYTMKQQGAQRCAFGSIVASGANACTLHYRANNQNYDKQSLMLIDAGAEYQGYASDITTAFPAGGKFNKAQKAIYQAVLNTHQKVLEQCKPGATFDSLHQLSCEQICIELKGLGILQGELEELMKNKAYQPYYMHRIGHWIGRDVHDVGKYHDGQNWQPLEANMALTIEPGIYILPHRKLDKKWWDIGVRIEDTIVITKDGYENLTPNLPRTIEEIEQFLSTA